MRLGPLIIVGAGLALLMSQRARAATIPQQDWMTNLPPGEELYSVLPPGEEVPEEEISTDYGYSIPYPGESGNPFISYISQTFGNMGGQSIPEVEAMLYAIRTAEVGRVPDSERYFYAYGYRRFNGTTDHPVITGEVQAMRLPDRMCIAAGRQPGCVSSAAGAYQFIRGTWEELKKAARLPDFSPASQDAAARLLLKRIGVTRMLENGDIEGAIRKAGTQWASLPGSTAQQNPVAMSRAMSLYQQGLAMTGGDTSGTMVV